MKEEYLAQFIDSKFVRHEVRSESISKLKRKLAKMDVLAYASISHCGHPEDRIVYYKPMPHNRKNYNTEKP